MFGVDPPLDVLIRPIEARVSRAINYFLTLRKSHPVDRRWCPAPFEPSFRVATNSQLKVSSRDINTSLDAVFEYRRRLSLRFVIAPRLPQRGPLCGPYVPRFADVEDFAARLRRRFYPAPFRPAPSAFVLPPRRPVVKPYQAPAIVLPAPGLWVQPVRPRSTGYSLRASGVSRAELRARAFFGRRLPALCDVPVPCPPPIVVSRPRRPRRVVHVRAPGNCWMRLPFLDGSPGVPMDSWAIAQLEIQIREAPARNYTVAEVVDAIGHYIETGRYEFGVVAFVEPDGDVHIESVRLVLQELREGEMNLAALRRWLMEVAVETALVGAVADFEAYTQAAVPVAAVASKQVASDIAFDAISHVSAVGSDLIAELAHRVRDGLASLPFPHSPSPIDGLPPIGSPIPIDGDALDWLSQCIEHLLSLAPDWLGTIVDEATRVLAGAALNAIHVVVAGVPSVFHALSSASSVLTLFPALSRLLQYMLRDRTFACDQTVRRFSSIFVPIARLPNFNTAVALGPEAPTHRVVPVNIPAAVTTFVNRLHLSNDTDLQRTVVGHLEQSVLAVVDRLVAAPPLFLERDVSTEIIDEFQSAFPSFGVVASNTTSAHPRLAAVRHAFRRLVTFDVGMRPLHVVGGSLTELTALPGVVHNCAPLLSGRDAHRHLLRHPHLVDDFACRRRFEDCSSRITVHATVVSFFSAHDIHPADFIRAMIRNEQASAYVALHLPLPLLNSRVSTYSDGLCDLFFERVGDKVHVMAQGGSAGYAHDLATLLSWASPMPCFQGVNVSLDLLSHIGSAYLFKIELGVGDQEVIPRLLPSLRERFYVLPLLTREGLSLEEAPFFPVPAARFEQLTSYISSCAPEDRTFEHVSSRVRGQIAEIKIGHTLVARRWEIDVEQFFSLVHHALLAFELYSVLSSRQSAAARQYYSHWHARGGSIAQRFFARIVDGFCFTSYSKRTYLRQSRTSVFLDLIFGGRPSNQLLFNPYLLNGPFRLVDAPVSGRPALLVGPRRVEIPPVVHVPDVVVPPRAPRPVRRVYFPPAPLTSLPAVPSRAPRAVVPYFTLPARSCPDLEWPFATPDSIAREVNRHYHRRLAREGVLFPAEDVPLPDSRDTSETASLASLPPLMIPPRLVRSGKEAAVPQLPIFFDACRCSICLRGAVEDIDARLSAIDANIAFLDSLDNVAFLAQQISKCNPAGPSMDRECYLPLPPSPVLSPVLSADDTETEVSALDFAEDLDPLEHPELDVDDSISDVAGPDPDAGPVPVVLSGRVDAVRRLHFDPAPFRAKFAFTFDGDYRAFMPLVASDRAFSAMAQPLSDQNPVVRAPSVGTASLVLDWARRPDAFSVVVPFPQTDGAARTNEEICNNLDLSPALCEVISRMIQVARSPRGDRPIQPLFISGPPRTAKSTLVRRLLRSLGQRAWVVVPSKALRDQWQEKVVTPSARLATVSTRHSLPRPFVRAFEQDPGRPIINTVVIDEIANFTTLEVYLIVRSAIALGATRLITLGDFRQGSPGAHIPQTHRLLRINLELWHCFDLPIDALYAYCRSHDVNPGRYVTTSTLVHSIFFVNAPRLRSVEGFDLRIRAHEQHAATHNAVVTVGQAQGMRAERVLIVPQTPQGRVPWWNPGRRAVVFTRHHLLCWVVADFATSSAMCPGFEFRSAPRVTAPFDHRSFVPFASDVLLTAAKSGRAAEFTARFPNQSVSAASDTIRYRNVLSNSDAPLDFSVRAVPSLSLASLRVEAQNLIFSLGGVAPPEPSSKDLHLSTARRLRSFVFSGQHEATRVPRSGLHDVDQAVSMQFSRDSHRAIRDFVDRQTSVSFSTSAIAAGFAEGRRLFARLSRCLFRKESTLLHVDDQSRNWLSTRLESFLLQLDRVSPLGADASTLRASFFMKTQAKVKPIPFFPATLPYGQPVISNAASFGAYFADAALRGYRNLPRILRDGVIIDVGFTDAELTSELRRTGLSDVLARANLQFDCSRQDSTHSLPTLVCFAEVLLTLGVDAEVVAFYLEYCSLYRVAHQDTRTVSGHLSYNLGSGDPFTLLRNCVMMLTALCCRYEAADRLLGIQKGDDFTGWLPNLRPHAMAGLPSMRIIIFKLETAAIAEHANRVIHDGVLLADPVRAVLKHLCRPADPTVDVEALYRSYIDRPFDYANVDIDVLTTAMVRKYPALSGDQVVFCIDLARALRRRDVFFSLHSVVERSMIRVVDSVDCAASVAKAVLPGRRPAFYRQFRNQTASNLVALFASHGIPATFVPSFSSAPASPGVVITETHAACWHYRAVDASV